MLIDREVRIPGVGDNDSFENWLLKHNSIEVHPELAIGLSDLGGIGLFFTHNEKLEIKDDIQLARIPRGATFDYMSLLEVLERLKEEEGSVDNQETPESQIITTVLRCLQPSSETEILTCYFIGLKICYNRRHGDQNVTMSPLAQFDPYLDVLAHTYVLGLPQHEAYEDEFIDKLVLNSESLREEYNELIETLGLEEVYLTFEEFYQVVGAVKSRVLEIPHGTDKDDDYYTNVTLVPLLDFANHLNVLKSNAYFDVDKSTGDVLLKLKSSKLQSGTFEVTISYSTTESVQHFIQTYGFIPRSDDYQLFEYRIPRALINSGINEVMNSSGIAYDKIVKWLRILPQFQLVRSSDDVFVNFFSNSLPLAFIEGLQYDEKWTENAHKAFTEYNEVEIDSHQFEAEVLPMLVHQESHYDVINAINQIGVTCNGKYPTQESILQDSGHESDDAFLTLISRCTRFIVGVAETTLKAHPPPHCPDTFSEIVSEYYNVQMKFLQSVVEKYKNKTNDLSLPVDVAKDEWETDYRSVPKQIILND